MAVLPTPHKKQPQRGGNRLVYISEQVALDGSSAAQRGCCCCCCCVGHMTMLELIDNASLMTRVGSNASCCCAILQLWLKLHTSGGGSEICMQIPVRKWHAFRAGEAQDKTPPAAVLEYPAGSTILHSTHATHGSSILPVSGSWHIAAIAIFKSPISSDNA